jgi:uncharacterized membrane protein YkoI
MMKSRVIIGSGMAVALMGFGMLVGSTLGSGKASAQTSAQTQLSVAARSNVVASSRAAVRSGILAQTTVATAVPTVQASKPTITQAQAEAAALAASPGNTIDHTNLGNQNGVAIYDVDFANGGGVIINAETGAVIATEAAGLDKGGRGGGGRGPKGGGPDQAALAAKATVSQADAEKAALAANPGSTVDHSRLGGDVNGTIFWDVDFANGGGVTVNAVTGAVITTEAAGTDKGGHFGGPEKNETQP